MKREKKFYSKGDRAITLIALIVTIVVLLILAGVSINMLTGENGLITRAKDAKDELIVGEEREQVELAYTSAKVKKIFVFPNIELRLNTFVGAKASSVNYHVIFSNEVSITDIENNFLDALKIEFNPQDKRNMNKYNIECFGKEIIKQNNLLIKMN